ncbi:hypothetical protein HJG60_008505 [Phyllostomus discolor]|uniref:Uncharacterized protein n=1 Tax=Phyllostomus discolor TaxID=89673 RepID=A0A833Z1R1_9CHIR|nr:hypothetical protein HJG60_008505 [Phyllostomus discolor]
MKPLPNQCLATQPHPGGQGWGRKGSGQWGVHFLGPACDSGLSSSIFKDQFLVLEKKKKARECEFAIYRKYQCFVLCFFCIVFCLPHVHILPKLGVTPPASDLATAPSFCSSHKNRQYRTSVPGGHRQKLLNLSTCSAPFFVLTHPSLP